MDIRVFLVDDSIKVRGLLEDLLSGTGFRVVGFAGTEAEANLWLDDHPGEWDLAIVDLMLEQGAGLSVVGRARLNAPTGKIIVFSGYATPGVRDRCIELGADEVFDKAETGAMMRYLQSLVRPVVRESQRAAP